MAFGGDGLGRCSDVKPRRQVSSPPIEMPSVNGIYSERRPLRGYAVKPPRVQLGWIMILIALVAIDLGVLRENLLYSGWTGRLLVQGTLPMANALVIGLLISRRRPKTRTFFLGFGAVGMIASASFALATIYTKTYLWIDWYAEFGISLMEKMVTRDRATLFITLAYLAVMSMLGVPQLVLAFLGGLFAGWVTRSRQRAFFQANP
jgi:hypothetical protein